MGIAFGKYKKSLEVDLSNLTFKEGQCVGHYLDELCYLDEDSDIEMTTKSIKNEDAKKLVKNLDKHN